jgi:hypothetical protein
VKGPSEVVVGIGITGINRNTQKFGTYWLIVICQALKKMGRIGVSARSEYIYNARYIYLAYNINRIVMRFLIYLVDMNQGVHCQLVAKLHSVRKNTQGLKTASVNQA